MKHESSGWSHTSCKPFLLWSITRNSHDSWEFRVVPQLSYAFLLWSITRNSHYAWEFRVVPQLL